MKDRVGGAMVVLVCGAAMVAAAQNSSGSQTNSSSSADKITVTGCIQRAAQTTTGTVGATGDAGTKFMLSNATRKAGAMSTTGTSGTSTPNNSSAASSASSYRLDTDDSKVSSHVGHTVEITGTLESASMSNSATSASSAPAAGQPNANSPTLKVDSVSMLSTTCS
jgi:hypothetical protein